MKGPIEFVTLEEIGGLGFALDHVGRERLRDFLNEALNRVFNKAVETAMLSMPDTVLFLLKHTAGKQKLAEQFLAQNPDLKGDEIFLEMVTLVESENAGWSYERILEEAGRRTREVRTGMVKLPGGITETPARPDLEEADEALNGAL